MKNPEWIIEYQDKNDMWNTWNETTLFNQRTFLPVFFTRGSAQLCIRTIKQIEYWKKCRFRTRHISMIKSRGTEQ